MVFDLVKFKSVNLLSCSEAMKHVKSTNSPSALSTELSRIRESNLRSVMSGGLRPYSIPKYIATVENNKFVLVMPLFGSNTKSMNVMSLSGMLSARSDLKDDLRGLGIRTRIDLHPLHVTVTAPIPPLAEDLPDINRSYEAGRIIPLSGNLLPDKLAEHFSSDKYERNVDYMIKNVAACMSPFEIQMTGLILTSTCVIAVGTDNGEINNARTRFISASREQNILQYMRIPNIIHITLLKFDGRIPAGDNRLGEVISMVSGYGPKDLGSFKVDSFHTGRDFPTFNDFTLLQEHHFYSNTNIQPTPSP